MNPTLPSWDTLRLVLPEIWLVLGMCAVILVPMIRRQAIGLQALTAAVTLVLALVATVQSVPHVRDFVLGGMLAVDLFSQFFKVLLLVFTLLVVLQWWLVNRHETGVYDTPDFLCLLLGATLGMALMASASNLLMIFMATESASLPSFVLAGFRKRHRVASEGALKYVVFGAASSAVMLYGMSLIYGASGSLSLFTIATRATGGLSPLLAVGLLCFFAGIAFKLSAVPMHFWCPDVFQGAPTEVTTFLSVASKGAAVALLVRVLQNLGAADEAALLVRPDAVPAFASLAAGVAILGAVTATWGNLVAYHQTNIKRLLAYSSIAHAGYMIMAASLLAVARGPGRLSEGLVSALLFYLLVYLFMNLGAFTVAAIIARQAGTEDIREYAGLARRSPALAVLMVIFLLSLFGMPGLGGFAGKFLLMKSMADVAQIKGWAWALVAVLLINTLFSLYYYLRPAYYMIFVADEQDRPVLVPRGAALALLVACAAALFWTGLAPNWAVQQTAVHAALLPRPVTRAPVPPAGRLASPGAMSVSPAPAR